MNSAMFSLIVVTLFAQNVTLAYPRQAASVVPVKSGSVETTPSTTPVEFDKLRTEGFDALYNLEYDTARERFKRMVEIAPDHPAGYVCLANNLWIETLNASRRLSASLYSSGSFYEQDKDSDTVDPKRDKDFNAYIKKALEVSAARLQKDSKDPEALYYQGGAYGLRAGYGASVQRSFTRAIGDANDSVVIQKKVIKIDPNYADAYLTVGFYQYVIDSLPFGWRLLARVAGLKGSKQKGIEQLEMVVQKGKFAADDARVVLMGVYTREGKLDRASQLVSELAEKYPRNYLFKVELAGLLFRLGQREKAEATLAALLKDEKIAQTASDLINHQWGEALFRAGDYAGAVEHFAAVKKWPKSDTALVSLAYLNSGTALDATGKRGEAIAEYQAVLKRENVYDSHKRANQYLKAPYNANGK